MSAKYYYLVSSLPHLRVDGESMTRQKFFYECDKWLSPADMDVLYAADMSEKDGKTSTEEALNAWRDCDYPVREELARARAAGAGQAESRLSAAVREILSEPTPLLMEKKLAQRRLDFIDNASGKYFFDLGWLVLYFLKIQILERLAAFDKDAGENFFNQLCEVKYG